MRRAGARAAAAARHPRRSGCAPRRTAAPGALGRQRAKPIHSRQRRGVVLRRERNAAISASWARRVAGWQVGPVAGQAHRLGAGARSTAARRRCRAMSRRSFSPYTKNESPASSDPHRRRSRARAQHGLHVLVGQRVARIELQGAPERAHATGSMRGGDRLPCGVVEPGVAQAVPGVGVGRVRAPAGSWYSPRASAYVALRRRRGRRGSSSARAPGAGRSARSRGDRVAGRCESPAPMIQPRVERRACSRPGRRWCRAPSRLRSRRFGRRQVPAVELLDAGEVGAVRLERRLVRWASADPHRRCGAPERSSSLAASSSNSGRTSSPAGRLRPARRRPACRWRRRRPAPRGGASRRSRRTRPAPRSTRRPRAPAAAPGRGRCAASAEMLRGSMRSCTRSWSDHLEVVPLRQRQRQHAHAALAQPVDARSARTLSNGSTRIECRGLTPRGRTVGPAPQADGRRRQRSAAAAASHDRRVRRRGPRSRGSARPLSAGAERLAGLPPLVRLLLQRAHDRAARAAAGQSGRAAPPASGRSAMCSRDHHAVRPGERRLPRQHLVGDHAERVEVAPRVHLLAGRLLRAHVRRACPPPPLAGAGSSPPLARHRAGDAEVRQQRAARAARRSGCSPASRRDAPCRRAPAASSAAAMSAVMRRDVLDGQLSRSRRSRCAQASRPRPRPSRSRAGRRRCRRHGRRRCWDGGVARSSGFGQKAADDGRHVRRARGARP